LSGRVSRLRRRKKEKDIRYACWGWSLAVLQEKKLASPSSSEGSGTSGIGSSNSSGPVVSNRKEGPAGWKRRYIKNQEKESERRIRKLRRNASNVVRSCVKINPRSQNQKKDPGALQRSCINLFHPRKNSGGRLSFPRRQRAASKSGKRYEPTCRKQLSDHHEVSNVRTPKDESDEALGSGTYPSRKLVKSQTHREFLIGIEGSNVRSVSNYSEGSRVEASREVGEPYRKIEEYHIPNTSQRTKR